MHHFQIVATDGAGNAYASEDIAISTLGGAVPTVQFLSSGQSALESAGVVLATVELNVPQGGDVSVPFTLSGTAVQGTDYQVSASPLVIPAGQTFADILVTLLDDDLEEGTLDAVLTLGSPTGALLGAEAVHTLSILDDEAPVGIRSDDFNQFNLDTSKWTFVDPVGDASLALVGTNTPDAHLLITVPAGVDHIAWTDLTAARIEQAASDTDFTLEVKLESPMSQAFQEQGLIVRQDDANFLRFDYYHDGFGTSAFAGSITNGSPQTLFNAAVAPIDDRLWMRVTRTGDQWTQEYSLDGVQWAFGASFARAMTVQTVGVFAGNASNGSGAPAHTVAIDYFESSFEADHERRRRRGRRRHGAAGLRRHQPDWC